MFNAHLMFSAAGALLAGTALGSVVWRSFKGRRRGKKETSTHSTLPDVSDARTLLWLASSADHAAKHAPHITSITINGGPEAATIGHLPPLILTFTELKQLNLVGTSLVHIPINLSALHKLEELQLSSNTIVCVPFELGFMTSLKSLDLSCNKISMLPKTLRQLTNLTTLNLMANQLTELPKDIGDLCSLRILGLKSNKLTTLPQSFTRLTSLVELFVTDNQLTSFPEGFGALTSLVKLQASFNNVQQLHADMLHATNLELMRVAVCQLDALPVQLTHLPTQLIHDEEVSGDTGSLAQNSGNAQHSTAQQAGPSGQQAEDPVVWPKLAWFSLGGNAACAPLPSPRPGLEQISASELTLGAKLGDGASGEVCRASLKRAGAAAGGNDVAVKIFRSDVSPDGRTQEEVAVSCALEHPHLTRVIGTVPGASCQPPTEQPLLVMAIVAGQPMAAKPTSKHLLRCRWAEGESFEPSLLMKVAKDIASALGYLHCLNICHGDVYAHNILLDKATGHATLCDFGASFAYPSSHWFWERMEVRAYGLFLHDMLQRMQSPPSECTPGLQRLQQLVHACTEAPPRLRLCFKFIGCELEELEPLLLC